MGGVANEPVAVLRCVQNEAGIGAGHPDGRPKLSCKAWIRQKGKVSFERVCVLNGRDEIDSDLDGTVLDDRVHLIDILPTLIEYAGTSYPATFDGNEIQPVEGVSLAPLLDDPTTNPLGSFSRANPLFFEHEGRSAIIQGSIKGVAQNDPAADAFELYDLDQDPQELNNIAGLNPALRDSLRDQWFAWADRAGVKDWNPSNLQDVSLSVTQSEALASGPVNGQFVVSRDSSSGAVNVELEVGGTAVGGTDYTVFPLTVGFSGGETQKTVDVVPLADAARINPVSLDVTVKSDFYYVEPLNTERITIASAGYDDVAAVELAGETGFDASAFGDPDGDGILNFQEIGQGTDPLVADSVSSSLSALGLDGSGMHALFGFQKAGSVDDVSWHWELSEDLVNWRMADDEVTVTATPNGALFDVEVMVNDEIANAPRQFGRIAWSWLGSAQGCEIASYLFASGGMNSEPTPFDITASTISVTNQGSLRGFSGSNEQAFARSSGTAADLATEVTSGDYFEFEVTVGASNPLTPMGVTFDHMGSSPGGGGFQSSLGVLVSMDGFATPGLEAGVSSVFVPAGQSATDLLAAADISLSSLGLGDFSGVLTFRIYAFDDSSNSDDIGRFDNLAIIGFLDRPLPRVVYDFEELSGHPAMGTGERPCYPVSDHVAQHYGLMPSAVGNAGAGNVAYVLGSETNSGAGGNSATQEFTIDFGGVSVDLSQLSFIYYTTNIDFNGSSFSLDLTSSATGSTVLATHTFGSSSGGTEDFSAAKVADLSVQSGLQSVSGEVTFTFTFTDNSTGSGRSHGIDDVRLTGE